MGLGDTFHFYAYTSDNNNTYGVKLSAAVAAAGGFSTTVSPATAAIWPFHAKRLRHVYGVDSAGNRCKLPIATPENALYVSGGSFPIGSRTYTVEGQEGERRSYNAVA